MTDTTTAPAVASTEYADAQNNCKATMVNVLTTGIPLPGCDAHV
ncbi:hypothetical protein [Nocardia anaemiae]|nr:hypothetical protein [Nocardia anaemiae]